MAPKNADDEVTKFIKKLRNSPSKATTLYGMVDAPKDPKDDGILFAPPGDCQHWAFIPRSAIKGIKEVGELPCGGHSHPLAKIQLKAPAGDVEKAYASVAHLHRTKLANLTATAAIGGPPTGIKCDPPKYWKWDNNSFGYICVDPD